jgi:YacP-like NYN domain
MSYVIDGYNLLHAMGLLRGKVGPNGLEKARLGLLGMLRAVYGDDSTTVTVVFDAAHAPADAPEQEEYQGIHVRFAVQQEQADDLIEKLIRSTAYGRLRRPSHPARGPAPALHGVRLRAVSRMAGTASSAKAPPIAWCRSQTSESIRKRDPALAGRVRQPAK